MLKKLIVATALASALVACGDGQSPKIELPKGSKLIEIVSKKGDEIVIPYKKFELSNGLTVVIHEDHSDPLVHVDVTYHVGSAREGIGRSGFAHFFEHMMFQGSENVGDEEHFKIVSEAGGTLNGSTNSDRTNYFETAPVNQLEKMLWLESDRMGFLLDAVTEKKFEVQRETVKNERGESVDNRPYGRLNETVNQIMYPEGHPYSWPIIGFMDDLNRANVNDVKAFFLRWYGPNNATLTIGGAVDVSETLKLVDKYFGSIPRGPQVDMPEKAPVTIEQNRYYTLEDNVHLPLVYVSYPTVYGRHKDEPALDLFASIIGGGETSILYKNLIQSGVAVQQSASHYCQELSCSFAFYGLPNPAAGKTLADIEVELKNAFIEFEKRGVLDADLEKAKAKNEARTINSLQSVAGKVSQLAANETFTRNPNYIKQDIERYNSVTKEDVMRVYKQYIKDKHAVIVSVVPKGQIQAAAGKANVEIKQRTIPESIATTEADLKVRKAVDSFDRSVQPTAGQNPLVTIPAVWQSELANGLNLVGAETTETPTTSFEITIPTGAYALPADKAGLVNLVASMLGESTTERSTAEMALELEKLGSEVYFYTNDKSFHIYVNTLSKHLDASIALIMERLLKPAFKQEEFDRVKGQTIQSIQSAKKNANSLATAGWVKLLYADTIAGQPRSGTLNTVNNITLDDVKAFYKANIKPKNGHLIVVSDLSEKLLTQSFKALNKWQGAAPAMPKKFAAAEFKRNTVYLINKDQAAQSVIRIGRTGMAEDKTGQFFKATLMNFNLGGAFNSRINLNLREDKGYTYGARSYFWGDKDRGGYTARASVRADATKESLQEFVKEISTFQKNGMTQAELEFMRKSVGQSDALKYETPRSKLGFMGSMVEHGLTPNFVNKQAKIINTVTLEELNSIAKEQLKLEDMVILVVGDAKTLKPQFEEMGYQVEMMQLD
jgi:zinc protease